MRTSLFNRFFALFILALAAAVPALAASPAPPAVNAQDRAAIIDDIIDGLNEIYVFPDTAEKMEQHDARGNVVRLVDLHPDGGEEPHARSAAQP